MVETTALVLIASAFLLAWLYIQHAYGYWKRRGVPYLKPTFPFGSFAKGILQRISIDDQIKEVYDSTSEPFIGAYSLLRPVLLMRDPELVRTILVKDFENFSSRGWYVNEHVDPMAHNMLVQNGDSWRNFRTKLAPTFTTGKLKAMFETVVKCGDSLESVINEHAKSGEAVEMRDIFARFVTNVIATVSFGIDIDCLKERDCEFRQYTQRFFEPTVINAFRNTASAFAPSIAKLFRTRFVDKDVGDFMTGIVKENLEFREKNNVTRKDFFQLLMQLKNTGKVKESDDDWTTKSTTTGANLMSVSDMSAQALLLFVAGAESSSATMSFCLYELTKRPELQQRVYEEIVSVLKEHNGELSYDALADMKYIECCIEETLRKHTPFGFVTRLCVKDYNIPDTNIVIEKGTQIMISMDGLQMDPKFYKDPMEWKPERFREEKVPFVERPFLAFGDGPRSCIGFRFSKLQTKLGLVLLLRKFRFELHETHTEKELEISPLCLAKLPTFGINLKVHLRA
ncbi:probable cytochrome P450 6d5 [Bradysia coprophila]|uniref:probable cytochrome P450 6d5 n=1 Tax=Bradysia coprophila TaxID=38358 RepID=UPI00187DB99A|nr:probable cytochrome P450 6d5 [Bradysia coprophila]